MPALRCFHTSQMLGHDPNLKKKKKQAVDQAKEKIRKDKQAAKRKAEPIIIPVDPDAVTGREVFPLIRGHEIHQQNADCRP